MDSELELLQELSQDFGEFKTKQSKELTDFKADVAANLSTIEQQLRDIKARGGHRKLTDVDGEPVETTHKLIKDALAAEFPKIKEQADEPNAAHKFKIKSAGNMTASANLTGSVVATYAAQPALRGRRKLHIRDLISVIPSGTGSWKFYRQNNPAGEGSFDFQTTHGNAKNQLDYDFTEVTITVDYLAGYARVAKQMLQDLPFLQSYLPGELVEDYLRTEDNKFFGSLYSAATGTAGTSSVTVEKIIETIANIEDNDHEVNGIVVTNQVWAKILKTKPNDYSIPGGVTITSDGQVAIAGIPVFKTNASNIGNNKVLMGDWSRAAIIQTEGLSVNMYEQDQDNAIRNLVTTVCEARVALAILRPEAFSYMEAGTT